MINRSFRREILDQISRLDVEQQRRVLDFARALEVASSHDVRGIQGKQLLRFAGAIKSDDLQIMAQAIEKDCEKVDSSEW